MCPMPRHTKWYLDSSSCMAIQQTWAANWGYAFFGGAGSPSIRVWPGPRPTSIPSGILIHPQLTRTENWGCLCPLFGRGSWVPIQHDVAWAEAYLPTKWHLDPSSHLATTDMGRKLGGGCAPLGRGSLVPIYHNVARAEAYLLAKFHLDPSNCLAIIHQRHRQTDRTDNGPIA